MKHCNYTEYRPKTIINPRWLSVILGILVYICVLIILYFSLRFIFDVTGKYSTSYFQTSNIIRDFTIYGIFIIMTIFLPWCMSYTRIHNSGILEMRYLSIRKKNSNRIHIKFEIRDIKEIRISYLRTLYFFERLYIRIITDKYDICVDVEEHNEFIKELLQYNPNIKTPELPII